LRCAGSLSIQLVKLTSIRDSELADIFTDNPVPLAFGKTDPDQN
jgi:hypothetical protein